MATKKVKIDAKPKATSTNLDEGDDQETNVKENPVPEASTSPPETAVVKAVKEKTARATKKVAHEQVIALVEAQPAPPDEPAKEQASEKAVKMKRLTLDISKPLHKAIKAKAVEEGISIADMLRALLKEHYGK
jgi:predicted HicB family RNase H-like nuclease